MNRPLKITHSKVELLLVFILTGCSSLVDSSGDMNIDGLSLTDIIAEYRIVDSLNVLSRQGKLDPDKIDRRGVIGRDKRNDLTIIRRCDEQRLFGCIMYENVFDLFYEDCDSATCEEMEFGVPKVDYEGFAGFPRFIGCAPDTSS